jgi:hypothetical protein
LKAAGKSGESALSCHDESVGQRLVAHFDRLERKCFDAHLGVDDEWLLVHERDATFLVVKLPVKWFAHLRQENIAVDQPDGAVALQHGQTDHVAPRIENLHCQGVRISSINGRDFLTQIAGAARTAGYAGMTKLRKRGVHFETTR